MAAMRTCARCGDRPETKEHEDEIENAAPVPIPQSMIREVGSGRSWLTYEEE